MKASELLDELKKRYDLANDTAIARFLEITPGRVSQMRGMSIELTSKQTLSLFNRIETASIRRAMAESIRPIVEYYPIEKVDSRGEAKWEVLPTSADHARNRKIRAALEKAIGIYIFYDSQGVALYVGQTERQSIWKEMKDAFNRERSNHTAYFVVHPTNGEGFEPAYVTPRQPVKQIVYLCDTAHYFSAYEVSELLVCKIEALLVRAFCNSLSNKKMEKF